MSTLDLDGNKFYLSIQAEYDTRRNKSEFTLYPLNDVNFTVRDSLSGPERYYSYSNLLRHLF